MYLITIPTTRPFDAAKALADALEYGRLTDPTKTWSIIGMALSASDARILAQAVANDRAVVIEVRFANVSCGTHYHYTSVEPERKPEPASDEELVIVVGDYNPPRLEEDSF